MKYSLAGSFRGVAAVILLTVACCSDGVVAKAKAAPTNSSKAELKAGAVKASKITAGKSGAEAGSQVEKGPKKDLRFQPDPALPNVLLLGDSISIDYTLPVRELLKGKANVFRPLSSDGTPVNCSDTSKGVAELERWLAAQPKWDVIHFNWGLHDLKHAKKEGTKVVVSADPNAPSLHTVAEYRANLEQIVTRLQQTHARLIFATTTPVPEGCNNPFRSPADPPRYNAAALELMKAQGIRVDDLYTFVLPRQAELQLPRNVHFTKGGSAALAAQVVQAISEQLHNLPQPKP